MQTKISLLFVYCFFTAIALAQLPKGLAVNTSGVTVAEYMYTENMRTTKEPIVKYGNQLSIRMLKISGFKAVNGKVQLLVDLKIKSKKGEILLQNPDVFKSDNEKGGLAEDKITSSLDLLITFASPLKLNEEYIAEFSVKDKNGAGRITGAFPFSAQLPPFITYVENGMQSDGPVLYTTPGNKRVTTQKLDNPEKLFAVFNNVKGFKAENGKVFPDARVTVKDEAGRIILEFPDLFAKENASGGVNEKEFNERLTLNFYFKEAPEPGQKYTCIFYVGDKKSKNSMTTSATLIWSK
jgi:hypothetical protein